MISQDVKTYVILDPPSKISSLSIVFKKMAEYNVKSDIYSHRYFYVQFSSVSWKSSFTLNLSKAFTLKNSKSSDWYIFFLVLFIITSSLL